MVKNILVFTLPGVFVNSAPWKNASKLWFLRVYTETKDKQMLMWSERGEDFQIGVNLAMHNLMPEATEDKKDNEIRQRFTEAIIQGVKNTTNLMNSEVVEYFRKLKNKNLLVLLSTTKQESINRVLDALNLNDLFDIVIYQENKETQEQLMEKLIKKYSLPSIFIGGNRKDCFYFCKNNNIPCIYLNLENIPGNKDIPSVSSIKELVKFLNEKVKIT